MTIFSPFLGGHRWFCGLRSVAKLLITPFLPNDYHKMGAIIMKHEQWLNIFLCTVRAELYKHLIFFPSRIIWGIFHHLNISDNVPIRAFLNEGTNFQRDHGGLFVQKKFTYQWKLSNAHMTYAVRVACLFKAPKINCGRSERLPKKRLCCTRFKMSTKEHHQNL